MTFPNTASTCRLWIKYYPTILYIKKMPSTYTTVVFQFTKGAMTFDAYCEVKMVFSGKMAPAENNIGRATDDGGFWGFARKVIDHPVF